MTSPACYAFNFSHLGLFEEVYIYLIPQAAPREKQAAPGFRHAACTPWPERDRTHFPLFFHTSHYGSDSATQFLCYTLPRIIATLDTQMLGNFCLPLCLIGKSNTLPLLSSPKSKTQYKLIFRFCNCGFH